MNTRTPISLRLLSGPLLIGCTLGACSSEPRIDWRDGELGRWTDGSGSEHSVDLADLEQHLQALPLEQRQPSEGAPFESWLNERLFEIFSSRVLPDHPLASDLRSDPRFAMQRDRQVETQLSSHFLLSRDASFEVRPHEIREEFEQMESQLRQPERRVFRALYLAFGGRSGLQRSDTGCELASQLATEARNGASFEQLVRQHSDSANASQGGLIGPVDRSQLRGEAARTVFSLEQGEVSDAVATPQGCFVFYVQQIQPALEPQLELLQAEIAKNIADRRRAAWRHQQATDAADGLAITLPVWFYNETITQLPAADEVVLETPRRTILGRELLPLLRQQTIEEMRLARRAIGDAVLAAAAAEAQPELAERLTANTERALLAQGVQRQLIQQQLTAIPNAELQTLYDERGAELVTEPRIELRLFAWPILGDSPEQVLAEPEAFLEGARQLTGAALDEWIAALPHPPREEVLQEQEYRALLKARPLLRQLLGEGEVAAGTWLGPQRVGGEIVAGLVERWIEARALSFAEATERLQRLWFEEHREETLQGLQNSLRERFQFRARPLEVNTLGALLETRFAPTAPDEGASTAGTTSRP